MKKLVLSFAFTLFVCVFAFANTNEATVVSKQAPVLEANIIKQPTAEDGFWQCIEMSRTSDYDFFSDTTTVTIT